VFEFLVVHVWKSYSRAQNFIFWGFGSQNLGEYRSRPIKGVCRACEVTRHNRTR